MAFSSNGSPRILAKNFADAILSCAGTMVWLSSIAITNLLTCCSAPVTQMVTISTTRGAKQKLMLAKLLFDASHAPPFVAGLLVAMYFQSYYLGYRRPYNMSSRDLENLSLSVRP